MARTDIKRGWKFLRVLGRRGGGEGGPKMGLVVAEQNGVIIMEEVLNNIFIRESLPAQFNAVLWHRISQEPPSNFQARQQLIYGVLLKEASLKDQYFQRFEQNHLRVYEWYLLAVRQKVEIEPYLFRPLLQRTPPFLQKKTRIPKHPGYPHRHSRTEPNEVRKLLVSPSKHKETEGMEEEVNSHQLYMQTFAACGGERYVPYDYGRHMKSRMERAHYNTYIRQGHKRNQSSPLHTQGENSLSRFMEWGQMKEKIALLDFRGVLSNLGLNSERGIQSLLKRKGNQKLVFVNHQRKPVNYYLRTQPSRQDD